MSRLPDIPVRRRFDVCNGDADGLCAVVQWRLAHPEPATLITGLKREIELLEQLGEHQLAAGDEVLVCDLSMQRNRLALRRLLEQGAQVRYFDHHEVRDVVVHPRLELHLKFDHRTCSSLLMDEALGGAWRRWALVGAYGDNLTEVADALPCDVNAKDRARLRQLGEAINYNSYGDEPADVWVAPARLYEALVRHRDPLQFLEREPMAEQLIASRRADLKIAAGFTPYWSDERACITLLPDEPWSRRVIGCLANQLAMAQPSMAHAVLKARQSGGYKASVRAPLRKPHGAHALCQRFGGSGRAAAAGIDLLPFHELHRFVGEFSATRWGSP
jgi:single-stranded DNA-specific DHH superfamily exonuclease